MLLLLAQISQVLKFKWKHMIFFLGQLEKVYSKSTHLGHFFSSKEAKEWSVLREDTYRKALVNLYRSHLYFCKLASLSFPICLNNFTLTKQTLNLPFRFFFFFWRQPPQKCILILKILDGIKNESHRTLPLTGCGWILTFRKFIW